MPSLGVVAGTRQSSLSFVGYYLEKRVLDGVVGPETNPLGDRTVLALGLAHLLLGAETLVALLELGLLVWLFFFSSSLGERAAGKRTGILKLELGRRTGEGEVVNRRRGVNFVWAGPGLAPRLEVTCLYLMHA